MGNRSIRLIALTPLVLLLSYYLAFFAHEYAHTVTAWLLGVKKSPFDLHYGKANWQNLFLLLQLHENVDYPLLFSQGINNTIALIAIAGIGCNSVIYLLTLLGLNSRNVKNKQMLYYGCFWLNFMCLAHLYHYVPLRVFSPLGDIANFTKALAISPWIIYVLFGYIVIFCLYHFYSHTLLNLYRVLDCAKVGKVTLLILCTLIMFGYVGLGGAFGQGDIPLFLSITSIASIPGIIIACWPTRKWVLGI